MRPRYLLGALLAVLVVLVIVLRLQQHGVAPAEARREAAVGCRQVSAADRDRSSGRWLTMSGWVSRILPDSYGTYRHQRFILRCDSGLTVLIVNDVSVGQRAPVQRGERVGVRGIYIWNAQGGLIHFTHRAGTAGSGGWLLVNGHVYAQAVDKSRDKEVDKGAGLGQDWWSV